jgi:hypothetical protein
MPTPEGKEESRRGKQKMKKSGEKTSTSTKATDTKRKALPIHIDSDVADMASQIQKWQIEAHSPYNDGWTQSYYREKLREIKEILGVYEEPIRVIT